MTGVDTFSEAWGDGPDRFPGLDEDLAAGLLTAVPLRMQEIAGWAPARQANDAAWVLELMRAGAAGDELLYGVGDGRPAAAFAALVRGLAALAYVEGGVTVAGLHWCAERHIECPNGPQWAHLGEARVDAVSVDNDPLGSAASPQTADPVVDGPSRRGGIDVRAGSQSAAEPQVSPRYVVHGDNGTRSPRVNTEPG